METISWSLDRNIGDFKVEEGGKEYMIKEVDTLRTMAAEADSMSAMRFGMKKADKAMWMDMKFYKTTELRKEGNTEDAGRVCNRAFFTHAKVGAGTKKWSMPCTGGRAEIWIS